MSDVRTHTYVRPSAVTGAHRSPDVGLETSGGATPCGTARHPHFHSGVVTASQATAAGLLAVAGVARTWYPEGKPGRAVLDPVVTGHHDRLRFEAISPCRGVYARLDILRDGVNGARIRRGTAHFDVNDALLTALARVRSSHPLHLRVGVVRTAARAKPDRPDGPGNGRLSRLPLRDFAEAQAIASRLDVQGEVTRARAQRLVRGLARQGGVRLWSVPLSGTFRLSTLRSPGAVPVPDAGRLEALQCVAPHMTSLRLYGPQVTDDGANPVSAWEASLPGMRLTLVPLSRGQGRFVADGAAPASDAVSDAGQSGQDAELLALLLSWEACVDPAALAGQAGLTLARTRAALDRLVDAGRCGYDLAEAAYFHRELPFCPREREPRHPRLVEARALVDSGSVTVNRRSGTAVVASGGTVHHVRELHGRRTCTCLLWTRRQGARGPCVHALAAITALREGPARPRPAVQAAAAGGGEGPPVHSASPRVSAGLGHG
ncbi:SWIM zinc finger family protein (plasmid) [Streptomyces sp. HUAS 31]|uniref:SWIM zinc finger family protein n=1 Tax=Streptomyces TaxID=1883 RepID=UPI002304D939|nr:SWIM zinc finger family protein [Streptomyces sp. HUAS 31]WCE02477.1 SWIM zinc finger family protein [Streptomyces sp. HUAS 31]